LRLNADEIRLQRACRQKAEGSFAYGHTLTSGEDVSLVVADFGIGSSVNDSMAAI
jgi:hypothetical protein